MPERHIPSERYRTGGGAAVSFWLRRGHDAGGRGSFVASQVTQMALDELHARRLTTVVSVAEDALARIELTLERPGHGGGRLAPARVQALRQKIASMRRELEKAMERFDLRLSKPEPQ